MGSGVGFGTSTIFRSCIHLMVGCGGVGPILLGSTVSSTVGGRLPQWEGRSVDGSVYRMGPAVSRSTRDSDWSIVSTVSTTHGPPEVLPIPIEVAWLKLSKFFGQYKSTNRFFVDLLPP